MALKPENDIIEQSRGKKKDLHISFSYLSSKKREKITDCCENIKVFI